MDTALRRAMRRDQVTEVERLLAQLELDPDSLKAAINAPDGYGLTFVHELLDSADCMFSTTQLTRLAHIVNWRHLVPGNHGYAAWLMRRRNYRIQDILPLLSLLHQLDPLALVKGFGTQTHILADLLETRLAMNSPTVSLSDVFAVVQIQPDLLETVSKSGGTALHHAVKHEDVELVRGLLSIKANVNAMVTDYYQTPLHLAAMNGHAEIVRMLLDAHANPNIRNFKNQTPIVFLLDNTHPSFPVDLVREMLMRITDVNIQDYRGRTVMHYVAFYRQPEVLYQALRHKHPDISVRDKLNQTPRDVIVANLRYTDPSHAHTRLLAFMHAFAHSKPKRQPDALDMKITRQNLKTETLVGYQCRTMDGIIMMDTLMSKFPEFTIPLECNHNATEKTRSEATPKYLRLDESAAALDSAIIFWSQNTQTVSAGLELALAQALNTHAFVGVRIKIILNNNMAHANLVLVDRRRKRWILFEPHGFTAPHTETHICHMFVKGVFSSMRCLKGFDFIMPNDMYDSVGFQALEISTTSCLGDPGGFCAAWSVWFVHFYIRNVNRGRTISVRDLVQRGIAQLLRDPRRTVREYIREYASYLALRRIKLLRSLGFGANEAFSMLPAPTTDHAVAIYLTQKWCAKTWSRPKKLTYHRA